MVLIMGAVAFLSSLGAGTPGVSHLAHLGGMLVGYLLPRGGRWIDRIRAFRAERRRAALRRQFEVYYGDVRRKIDEENKKGPTMH